MNALGSLVCDSSVTQAGVPAGVPLGPWPGSAWARVNGIAGPADALADRILSPSEWRYWTSLRAVEKRRREWLMGRAAAKEAVRSLLAHTGVQLLPAEIEIVPDGYGRPAVKCRAAAAPMLSIAHSHGVAVALAVLDPGARVGIDLESLAHRRSDFETIAFSPDERDLLAALPPELRQEWALRMWGAKESVGKALGRGLSAGLLAFHITRIDTLNGMIAIKLRDTALSQFPEFDRHCLHVYTARASDFIFSAIIYQQGAVRMRPSRQEILDYLLHKMGELTQDWDYPDPVRPESKLFTELGFESLDAVVLCTAIQEHYQTPMPFAELLAEIGQQQRDLSIDELTDFVNTHLGGVVGADATRRVQ